MKTMPQRPDTQRPVHTLARPIGADSTPFSGWGPRVPGI
jgi:hypothetical protein